MSAAKLISIVDDDISVCKATARLLEAHGYSTASFASAEEFLRSELLTDTSCLVSDMRMTGLNGAELQRRLREAGHFIPTIFITSYPDEHLRKAALKDGAVSFLTKPVRAERLISCLKRALRDGP